MTTESAPQTRNILRRKVPRRVVYALVIALPIVGFLVGSIGALGPGGSTTSVTAAITPRDIGLKPGQAGSVTVLVRNPDDEGMRVASIDASQSQASKDCPAGALTSEEVSNPTGYIAPEGINAYAVTVTLQDKVAPGCLTQSLALPLTVELTGS